MKADLDREKSQPHDTASHMCVKEDSSHIDRTASLRWMPWRDFGVRYIRDNVHGDVAFPEKFLRIVNTAAFQRLHRIKQLATAQYVFPSADHTRFAHSIGTFAVMQRILAHFDEYFRALGLPEIIDRRTRDALLAASLLHDLGHAPFSHALERVLPNNHKFPHEIWTTTIIREDSELRTQLGSIFEDEYREKGVQRVIDLIHLQHNDKDSEDRSFFPANEMNMENIFRSLISSQLDADRLDYIRRDSLATGLSYGLIDIDRLISGFRIGILNGGQAVVCISKKYLPDVEGYLYARYQMYRNVYFRPYKMLTECLLKKIIYYAYKLYDNDILRYSDLPPGFKSILQKPSLSMSDYLLLDDYVVLSAIKYWSSLYVPNKEIDEEKECEIPTYNTHKLASIRVFSEMCRCLLNRSGFERCLLRETSKPMVERFKNELAELIRTCICSEAGHPMEIEEMPFLIVKAEYPQIYKADGQNLIYIIDESGKLIELSKCSNLIRSFPQHEHDNLGSNSGIVAVYYNRTLLKYFLEQIDEEGIASLSSEQKTEVERRVCEYLESWSARNVEIEKKYEIPASEDPDVLMFRFESLLKENGYTVTAKGEIQQVDHYFDTLNDHLLNANCTLRIRHKQHVISVAGASTYRITCKMPIDDSCSSGKDGQMERYEYAADVPSESLKEVAVCDFVTRHLPKAVDISQLRDVMIINNKRSKYDIQKGRDPEMDGDTRVMERYELVLDAVTYHNTLNGKEYSENQIELELKSDPITRLNMQLLTDTIQRAFPMLKILTNSKYERGRKFTVSN